MAQQDTQIESTENSNVDETVGAPEIDQAQNPDGAVDASAGADDSPSTAQPDYEGRIRALEEQHRRAEERNRYLEQTTRLLEAERQQWQRQQSRPAAVEPSLAPELLELDKTLDPIFAQRLKGVTQPLVDTVSRLYDEQDSSRFEMYLMRNHPEIFDEEGGLDRVFQEVESVRQRAAQAYNQWLSRVDAFLYAQGIHGVQTQAKTRKEKKTAQVREEAKRIQTVRAAGSGVQQVAPRKSPNAEIQSIREKANRGERLTDSERQKFKDFVGGVSF